jgi:glyoxylase-like metal-dependent hydrolase (beta-lactamase superfamily II)
MKIVTIPAGSNCYLVSVGEKTMMIDAGFPGQENKIEKAIKANNIRFEDIQYLILTHGHYDHIGSAAYFQEKFGTRIVIHEADVPLIDDNHAQTMQAGSMVGRLIIGASKMSAKKKLPKPLRIGITIKETQENALGFGEMIHFLPGHTRGSIGISFPTGEFFAGDLFMNFISPHCAYLWENNEVMQDSLKTAIKLPIHTIYPGHGKAFSLTSYQRHE